MVSAAECLLRDNLKQALQNAKSLFDEGLLDEKEFKDLKSHALGKYKEQLAVVTASAISHAVETTPPAVEKQRPPSDSALRTPLNSRAQREGSGLSPGNVTTPLSPTRLLFERPKPHKEDVLYVDASTYRRLKTPPIFRRRVATKRKIVLPCGELQNLQGFKEEKTNAK